MPRPLLDPKRIHRALFGVYYEEDVLDRFVGAWPGLLRLFRPRIEDGMRQRRLIFIHVPRVAGTSVVHALYETDRIRHHSARSLRAMDPDFFAATESFAVVRDPFDRFASAYSFVRKGGTPT